MNSKERKQQIAVQLALKKHGVLHHYNDYDKRFQGAVLPHGHSRFDLTNVKVSEVPNIASKIRDIEVRKIKMQRRDSQRHMTNQEHRKVGKTKYAKTTNDDLRRKIDALHKEYNEAYHIVERKKQEPLPDASLKKAQIHFDNVAEQVAYATGERDRRKDSGRYSQVKY